MWSSYMCNAWGVKGFLQPHEEYLKLGTEVEASCQVYRELFRHALTGEDVHKIENAMQTDHPVGDNRFKRQIKQQYGIEFGRSSRGRPRKRDEWSI